jgi:hypothetical protein
MAKRRVQKVCQPTLLMALAVVGDPDSEKQLKFYQEVDQFERG